MRASIIVKASAAGALALGLLAAGPAAAQCAWDAAKRDQTIASTVEAPVLRTDEGRVVLAPRTPAPREIVVTQGVPAVTGIRPAPVEPPAIYVIEAAGTILVDPS
ncbi:hypothetical protein ACTZWW_05100 [Salinarimonas sp. NSM]|uniref:hypothetical protein n=1 Tax=Salinarimonas sp. NSM TaxID=3458003 RepID=UPI004036C2D8